MHVSITNTPVVCASHKHLHDGIRADLICSKIRWSKVAESISNYHKNYLVFYQKLIETAKAYKYVLVSPVNL